MDARGPVVAGIVIVAPVVEVPAVAHVVVAGIDARQEFPHGDVDVLESHGHAFLGHDQVGTAVESRLDGLFLGIGDGTVKVLEASGIGDPFVGRESEIAVELHFRIADVVPAADDFLLGPGKLHPVLQHVGIGGHVHTDEGFGGLQLFLDAPYRFFRCGKVFTGLQQRQELQLDVGDEFQAGLAVPGIFHIHLQQGFLHVVQVGKAGKQGKRQSPALRPGLAAHVVGAVGLHFFFVLEHAVRAHKGYPRPEVALGHADIHARLFQHQQF